MEDNDPQHPKNNRVWKIRSKSEYVKPFRPAIVYDGYENFFTIKLHYGGVFTQLPGRRYALGKYTYVDYCNIDEFSVHEIDWVVRELELNVPDVSLYYQFKIPELDLDLGLCPLGNDGDVLLSGKYVAANKVIRVYIEHGETKVRNYLSPTQSSKVVIEEIETDGGSLLVMFKGQEEEIKSIKKTTS